MKFAMMLRKIKVIQSSLVYGRFVCDPVIGHLEFAADCLNGRLRRCTVATVLLTWRRRDFCERVQQIFSESAVGSEPSSESFGQMTGLAC
jgi:hypothetical protein